jgi:hypothetical protein
MKNLKQKEYTKRCEEKYKEIYKKKRTEYSRRYREKNREEYNKKQRERWENNKETYKEYNKISYLKNKKWHEEYRAKNKEKISLYRQEHQEHLNELARIRYAKNKDKHREYRQQNKERLNEHNKKWQKKARKTNSLFRIKSLFRSAVLQSFKRIGLNKPTNTEKLMGCTAEEAKAHIESLFQEGMTWENYGEWHIDHIRPVCTFTEVDIHLMNNIKNLQPLWAEDNFKKSSKY